jgi:hypothetical protein
MMNVDAFEKHVLTRQLKIARILADHFVADREGDPLSESAFAILHLCVHYFEMVEQFESGQSSDSRSKLFFVRGFRKVFPALVITESDLEAIYRTLRCGMYHSGIPKSRIFLDRDFDCAISFEDGTLTINPSLFVDVLIQHFENFCSFLRDDVHHQLQENARKIWGEIQSDCIAKEYDFTPTKGTPNPADVAIRNTAAPPI